MGFYYETDFSKNGENNVAGLERGGRVVAGLKEHKMFLRWENFVKKGYPKRAGNNRGHIRYPAYTVIRRNAAPDR